MVLAIGIIGRFFHLGCKPGNFGVRLVRVSVRVMGSVMDTLTVTVAVKIAFALALAST